MNRYTGRHLANCPGNPQISLVIRNVWHISAKIFGLCSHYSSVFAWLLLKWPATMVVPIFYPLKKYNNSTKEFPHEKWAARRRQRSSFHSNPKLRHYRHSRIVCPIGKRIHRGPEPSLGFQSGFHPYDFLTIFPLSSDWLLVHVGEIFITWCFSVSTQKSWQCHWSLGIFPKASVKKKSNLAWRSPSPRSFLPLSGCVAIESLSKEKMAAPLDRHLFFSSPSLSLFFYDESVVVVGAIAFFMALDMNFYCGLCPLPASVFENTRAELQIVIALALSNKLAVGCETNANAPHIYPPPPLVKDKSKIQMLLWDCFLLHMIYLYRVTHQVGPNLPLT